MTATTSPPSNNPLLVLLDFLASPLLLFNAEGGVVHSNQAAKSMSCRPALLLGSDPNVRHMVKDISSGRPGARTEIRVEALSDDGVARLVCRSAPRPIAGLVAMAVSEATDPADTATPSEVRPEQDRMSLQQIMELLKNDLVPSIEQVLAHPAAPASLSTSLEALRERLERTVDLVNVFGDDLVMGEERMIVADLVHDICEELAPLAEQARTSFVFNGIRDDLPPVYGSQRLLRRALRECLHNAVAHARDGVTTSEPVAVGVGFRASGQHLMVSIQSMGTLSASALARHASAIFRPAVPGQPADAQEAERLRIGLPLTQRILQLHGGNLRIEQDRDHELDVMVELPTGAPMRNTHHLDMLQAQIYAEDLSKLMARSRKRSAA